MAFRLTNLRSDDQRLFGRATTFLLENPDPGVRIRPDEQVRLALDTGQGLVLLRGDEICGLSLVYKFEVGEVPKIFSEMGTMRITANGLGLQELFASLHLLQISLEEDDAGHPEVFAVVSPDTASAHILEQRVGMVPAAPPVELASVRGRAGVPFSPAKKVLWARLAAFEDAGAKLLSWHQHGREFRTPKGGETLVADLGWLSRDVLEAYSK